MGNPDCMCDWDDGCSGLGTLLCRGCGGDLCVCVCGGETECPGCEACDPEGEDLRIWARRKKAEDDHG